MKKILVALATGVHAGVGGHPQDRRALDAKAHSYVDNVIVFATLDKA